MSTHSVLSTKRLNDDLHKFATACGINVIEEELTRIELLNGDELRAVVNEVHDELVIFTSRNAVSAVSQLLNDKEKSKNWKVYAVGAGTAKVVSDLLLAKVVNEPAGDGSRLAKMIIEAETPGNAVFFCGDKRRDVVPDALIKAGFRLKEFVVYQTILTPLKNQHDVDGILFFSPTAVQSFFSANNISSNVVCFAIGNTTGNELRKFTTNKIITAAEPSEKEVIQLAADTLN